MIFAALLLLSSTKNNIGCSPTSVLQLVTVLYVFILAQHRVLYCTVLGNVASTKTICCTCNNCSVSRSSSLVGGRPTSSLLP